MRTPKSIMLSIILLILSLSVLITVNFLPWYEVHMDVEDSDLRICIQEEWHLDRGDVRTEFESSAFDAPLTESLDESFEYHQDDPIKSVMDRTWSLLVVCIISSSISLVILGVSIMRRTSFKWASGMTLLTGLLILTSCAHFVLGLTGAMEESMEGSSVEFDEYGFDYDGSFIGSSTPNDGGIHREMTWGPSHGWYLLVLSSVVTMSCWAMVFSAARKMKSGPSRDMDEWVLKVQEDIGTPRSSRIQVVQCPACNTVFEITEDASSITCPRCGISGEMDGREGGGGPDVETGRGQRLQCPKCNGVFSIPGDAKEMTCPHCGVKGQL